MLRRLLPFLLLAVALLLTGCPPPEKPDEHREVFESATQAATRRIAEIHQAAVDDAIDYLKFHRPDISIAKANFGISLTKDACSQTWDFTPLANQFAVPNAKRIEILKPFVAAHLPQFDNAWARSLGFASAKSRIEPMLISHTVLQTIPSDGALHEVPVAGDLSWTPILPTTQQADPVIISTSIISEWQVAWPAVEESALANIAPRLVEKSLLTTPFPPYGRLGAIAPGVNPSIIIAPGFLDLVRKSWQSEDDLVILAATHTEVRFIERKNIKLLDAIYPTFESHLRTSKDPLCRFPILLDAKGFTVLNYQAPSTQPASQPAATRPTPYIVH